MKKTSDGGNIWITQTMPQAPIILSSGISKFAMINKDTVFGIGALAFYGSGRFRGLVYKTTNGGNNWGYQQPDTSINLGEYLYVNFIDKFKGWAYTQIGGIHTKTGGLDTTIFTAINQPGTEIVSSFKLYQNYPNPFNPTTTINYEIRNTNYVLLKVYDLQGKEVKTLVNQKQNSGSYSIKFDGSSLSSGIYFYTLQTENYKETKKMMLIK